MVWARIWPATAVRRMGNSTSQIRLLADYHVEAEADSCFSQVCLWLIQCRPNHLACCMAGACMLEAADL